MNTTLTDTDRNSETKKGGNNRARSLDQSLIQLQTGRRLEQVSASIESFLLSQVARIEEALGKCQLAVNQNQIVQRILADFEKQKLDWERQREAEADRLYQAGEKLIEGWRQLEAERREWMSKRNSRSNAGN
jgi:hypothetical protein